MPTQKKPNQNKKDPKNISEFIRFQNSENGLYYYKYNNEEKEALLISATGYANPKNRDKGIESLVKNITHSKFFNENRQYYFVIKSIGNNAELARSKSFPSKKTAQDAYHWFKNIFISPANENTATVKVVDKKESREVNSKTGPNQRYAFRLTFYPEGNSRELRGSIEYVLKKRKKSFLGLDLDAIHGFLKENLPIFEEKALILTQKEELLGTENKKISQPEPEKLVLEFIQDGQLVNTKSISNEKSIEAQIDILDQEETPFPEKGDYEVYVFAKSLQTGKKTLAGQMIGVFPTQGKLKCPVFFNSIGPGPYRILSSLKWYAREGKKELRKNSVSGSSYLMVY